MQDKFTTTKLSYKKAIYEARHKNFPRAFSLYVDTFLPRLCSDHSSEKEFKCFYRLQLASYLYGKKNYLVALPEGDMVSDLILDAYDNFLRSIRLSRFNVTNENRINLLSNVRVVFPLGDDISHLD